MTAKEFQALIPQNDNLTDAMKDVCGDWSHEAMIEDFLAYAAEDYTPYNDTQSVESLVIEYSDWVAELLLSGIEAYESLMETEEA